MNKTYRLIWNKINQTWAAVSEIAKGRPHEEGIDYPEGSTCPRCPFWAHRDRWSGEVAQ
jgi:Extended Signal Peptide of Type V secretion system